MSYGLILNLIADISNYQLNWDVTYKGIWVDHYSGNDSDGIGAGLFSLDITVWN